MSSSDSMSARIIKLRRSKTMAKVKKDYTIFVDFAYGLCDTFTVSATSLTEAKKKAKAKFARTYFKMSYLQATKE